ncbi:LOW QUALITY PROTEIN: hypothetical protein MSG28_000617 [Choristoneura fumiferana]|uniref:Uncharacterized protein n=1 Tax=Choristoneura fumiferana TaxID=7141 RepID=A0ACC0K233_CHOFU|nr:LOW QUALITY PROTEIN: hypothetical protein MSG28_000617 [Choristoneura fumiferana]
MMFPGANTLIYISLTKGKTGDRNIFSNDFNFGFHVTKKDKCGKCVSYNEMMKENTLDEKSRREKEKHDVEKKRQMKDLSFTRTKDRSTLCVSFDMQKSIQHANGRQYATVLFKKICCL